MKKYTQSQKDHLIGLMLYHLFKRQEGLDAYCIAIQIGAAESGTYDNSPQSDDVNEVLKSWIELGCKVNFCWLENKGELHELMLSTYDFEKLRQTDRELHQKIKSLRDKVSGRWSNDWNLIGVRILAAKSLYVGMPRQESLMLTWQAVQADCARKLQQMSKQSEAESLQRLSLESLIIKHKRD